MTYCRTCTGTRRPSASETKSPPAVSSSAVGPSWPPPAAYQDSTTPTAWARASTATSSNDRAAGTAAAGTVAAGTAGTVAADSAAATGAPAPAAGVGAGSSACPSRPRHEATTATKNTTTSAPTTSRARLCFRGCAGSRRRPPAATGAGVRKSRPRKSRPAGAAAVALAAETCPITWLLRSSAAASSRRISSRTRVSSASETRAIISQFSARPP
ncbi:MAG TPA: hypothetical protein DEP69_00445 [Acidimicrobiaceae bacterium]|nr:hypothetical protein [Acidimicrobiaceae bacterium]